MKNISTIVLFLSLFAIVGCSSPVQTDVQTDGQTESTPDPEIVDETAPQYDYYTDQLEDVSGGDAYGFAGAIFENEQYILTAEFENLPELKEGYFYEGWVVRNSPLSVISSGVAEEVDGKFVNEFTSSEDLSDHLFYVLTLEPDDGDPAPAEHILEGTLSP